MFVSIDDTIQTLDIKKGPYPIDLKEIQVIVDKIKPLIEIFNKKQS